MLFTFGAKDEVDGKSDEDGERQDEPRGVGKIGRERGLIRKNGHGGGGVGNMNSAGRRRATKTRGL